MWQSVASVPDKGLLRTAVINESTLLLAPPTEGQEIVEDYRHLGLTLGRHPVALLRPKLGAMRFSTSESLHIFPDGKLARGCGIVTVRQRPATAKGVTFVTIEDETGYVNVIVWPNLAEKQRSELSTARLLGVYGKWQSCYNVRHLIALRLVDLTHFLGGLETHSRDYA